MSNFAPAWQPTLPRMPGRPDMVSVPVISLGQAPGDVDLTPQAYATASLFGANVGGAILGFLASRDKRGAAVGASFAGGLAGLGNAVMLAREHRKGAAVIMGLLGVASLGGALVWSEQRARRRGSWI